MKMNLGDTWKNCLSMWRWIAKEVRGGDQRSVCELKTVWLNNHDLDGLVTDDCFFCDYGKDCQTCPGRRVDPKFTCDDISCHWDSHPIAFYNKLVSLNRKRLKAKD